MGSGGLRGLQILRSGASGVRGGFDSHAFPPPLQGLPLVRRALAGAAALTLAVGFALASAPSPARAEAPADSLAGHSRVDVVGGARPRPSTRTAPDRSAPADSVRRIPWHDQPRFVMARSLVIPGWGQVYNHAWLKAAAIAGVEGWMGASIVQDQRKLDDLLRELDRARRDQDQERESALVNEYNDQLSQRLARQWTLGAVVAYALVDAYVDAHFRGFDLEFKHDPALPAGTSPAHPGGGAGDSRARGPASGVRLGLRWRF